MTGIERQALITQAQEVLASASPLLVLLMDDARTEELQLSEMICQRPDPADEDDLWARHQASVVRLHDLNTSIAALRRVAEMRAE